MRSFRIWFIGWVILAFVASCYAGPPGELSDEIKAFNEKVKGTQWEFITLRPGDPIPILPNEQEQKNNIRFVEAVDAGGGVNLITLIHRFDLYSELDVTESQQQRLNEIAPLEPAHIKNAIGGPDVYKLSDSKFTDFLREFKRVSEKHRIDSEAAIEKVLSQSQLKRLRQIGFQFYMIRYTQPRLAFRYHGVALDEGKLRKIEEALVENRNVIRIAEKMIQLHSKAQAIKVIANKKVPLGEFVSVPQIPKDVQTAVLDLFASRNPSPVPEFTEATETLPGRRGNGASYLAVCSHPAAAASLNLTKAQQHEIEQMLNEVRAVYDFKVNPNDAYDLQKQRYAENRAKRKTINIQMDTKSRELLDTQQKKIARQLKLQFDLEGEYYGAVLKSIGSDFSDEQRGALQQELVFVSHDAKYMAGQLKRHLLISKLEGIIGESDLRRYLGKPFEFGDGLQNGVQVVPQELLRQPTKNPRRQGR